MRTYLRLSSRYLLVRKGRTLMTFLGIALGVTMVVAVLLTNDAIISSYRNLITSAAGRADLQVTGTTGAGMPAELLGEVHKVAGVQVAAPAITSGAPVIADGKQTSATIYGIDPELDRQVRDYRMTDGALPAGVAEVPELAVSKDLAQALGLKTGKTVQLLTVSGMQTFTITGVFDATGTVRGSIGPFGVMPLGMAQSAFGRLGKLDQIDVVAERGRSTDDLRRALEAAVAGRARVAAPAERSQDMRGMLDSITFMLTLAGSISLFAGAFIIYTNVAMSVSERRRDLSILRALGMRRREVVALVVGEAVLFGLAGAALGVLMGFGLAGTMATQVTRQFLVVYGIAASRVALSPQSLAAAFAVGIGVAVAAAYGPARETLAVSPVEAMRPGEAERVAAVRSPELWILAGLAMLAVAGGAIWATWPRTGMISTPVLQLWGMLLGLSLLGVVTMLPVLLTLLVRWVIRPLLSATLGVTGRLAADNLLRQPRRASATISALMVSLTFMVGIGGVAASQKVAFQNWFDKTVGWDLLVSTSFAGMGAQVEIDPAFGQDLQSVPGVKLASPQKLTRVMLTDGQPAFLQVFDHTLLSQYSNMALEEGNWPEVAAAMSRGGGIILSPAVARRLEAKIGDQVKLATPSGEKAYTVRAIMVDVYGFGGTVQLDRRDYVRDFADQTVSTFGVVLQKGADPAGVKAEIMRRWGDAMHLQIRLNRDFWQEVKGEIDAFFQLMNGLIMIAVGVAGLAIANTLFASLLERKREIGVMRAVGTRRREIGAIVVGEAFGTGLVGGLIGLVAGLAFERLITASGDFVNGTSFTFTIDWSSIGVAMAVALVVAPLVGALPARWAARLDVVEALQYE